MIKLTLILLAILVLVVGFWSVVLTLGYRSQTIASRQRFAPAEEPSAPLGKTSDAASAQNTQRSSPTPLSKGAAKARVTVGYTWSKDGFGTIMMVDFTFNNPTPYPARDITVTCTHYGPSGTEIDSNTRTIYEIIPANGKKKIKEFNMGFIHSQAKSTSCKIDDLEM